MPHKGWLNQYLNNDGSCLSDILLLPVILFPKLQTQKCRRILFLQVLVLNVVQGLNDFSFQYQKQRINWVEPAPTSYCTPLNAVYASLSQFMLVLYLSQWPLICETQRIRRPKSSCVLTHTPTVPSTLSQVQVTFEPSTALMHKFRFKFV